MKRPILYAIVVFFVSLSVVAESLKSNSLNWGVLFILIAIAILLYRLKDISPGLRRFINKVFKAIGLPPQPKDAPDGDERKLRKRNAFDVSRDSVLELAGELVPKDNIVIEHEVYRSITNYERKVAWALESGIEERCYFITGMAGSGKTVELLKRLLTEFDARQVEMGADRALSVPSKVPVYLKLNDWKLDEDLGARVAYQLEQTCGLQAETWIDLFNHRLLTLYCDGLDEVDPPLRKSCLQALIAYSDGPRVYIACQKEVLDQILPHIYGNVRSRFGVLELLNLQPHKVLEILRAQKDGRLLAACGERILQHLKTPLHLHLFIGACSSLPAEERERLKQFTDQQLEHFLYETYIRARLDEKLKGNKRLVEWTMSYLIQIARYIPTNTFFIDKIQPNWLNASSIFNYYLLSRIISAIVLAIAMGFIIASPFELVSVGVLAGLVTTFLTFRVPRNKDGRRWPVQMIIPIFSLILLCICGFFQGLLTPRSDRDMTLHGLFGWTDSLAGAIIGIFYGVFFGYRRGRQTHASDIQPMEKFKPNWPHSTRTGIKASLWLGVFIGLISILIKTVIPGSDSYHYMFPILAPVYNYLKQNFSSVPAIVIEYLTFFLLAFSAAFCSGFLIFGILAGRDDPKKDGKDDNKQYSPPYLNYGIIRSLRFSVQFGLLSFLGFTILYGSILVLATQDHNRWIRATMMGIGIGMLTSLCYGGLEFIQYWVLRLLLYAEGKLPLHFYLWARKLPRYDLLIKQGAAFSFRHNSMMTYLKTLPATAVAPPKRNSFPALAGRLSMYLILVIIVFSLAKPFANRYFLHHFWQRPDEINFDIQPHSHISPLSGQRFVMMKTDTLTLTVMGAIDVGTYTGLVGPSGTNIGFLGFPLDGVYNRIKTMPHAALLVRKLHGHASTEWVLPEYKRKHFLAGGSWDVSIPVQANDTVTFMINDSEWENNSGNFNVLLRL